MRTGLWPTAAALLTLVLLPTLPACSRFTKEGADEEVYGILDEDRRNVPEMVGRLDVDAADRVAEAARRCVPYRLTLDDALALAARTSRDYLREREEVYLAALSLTGARNRFNPLFGGGLDGALEGESGGVNDGVTASGGADANVSRAFETGGSLVLAIATDFLENLTTGNPFRLAQTLLRADLVLPLARGAGWVARENLIQAERNALYAMRDFARFQQEFTVDVTSSYYRILQRRNTWKNEETAYESLLRLLERQEALGATGAGRIPDFEVDQTRQDKLRADERRLLARIAYFSALDDFKLQLGIRIRVDLDLPDDDLERLYDRGPVRPPYGEPAAVGLALEERLDLDNARDQEVDAWRKVLVAENALGPDVNLELGGALRTADEHPFDLTQPQVEGLLGLDIDLPLERTAERNAFRAALIQAARARRQRQAREDGVVLQVRESYRRLDRAERSYEIQADGARLAERRVESTNLLLEAGKASTRDRLEAEDARVRARNASVLALVDHAIARLELELNVGTLQVGADALWVPAPPAPEADAAEDPPAGTQPDPPTSPPPEPPPVPDTN